MGLCLYACRPLLSCYHPYLVCIHFGSHPYIFLHFSECVSFLVSVLSDVTLDLIGVSSFAVTSLQQPETSPSCFCSHRWVSAWIVDFGRWSTLASFTDSHMSVFKSHLQCTNIAVMCFQREYVSPCMQITPLPSSKITTVYYLQNLNSQMR